MPDILQFEHLGHIRQHPREDVRSARIEQHHLAAGRDDVLVRLDGDLFFLLLPAEHDELVIPLVVEGKRTHVLHSNQLLPYAEETDVSPGYILFYGAPRLNSDYNLRVR